MDIESKINFNIYIYIYIYVILFQQYILFTEECLHIQE